MYERIKITIRRKYLPLICLPHGLANSMHSPSFNPSSSHSTQSCSLPHWPSSAAPRPNQVS